MVHVRCRAVLVVLLCAVLLGHVVKAEDAQHLKPCVLVLPFQASPDISGDQVFLGLAVQNVLENVLAVHSMLEECWSSWYHSQLFPHQQALRDWVQGTGELPAAIPELRLQYLLTGQVRFLDQEVQVTVELLDRSTGHRLSGTLPVDLPKLETLRTGFIELLAHAGVPVPTAQQPKMLWPEALSLTAFTSLGHGLYIYFSTNYDKEQTVFNPQQFAEALQRAPHSYLVLNNLGWGVYKQKQFAAAVRLFEQALTINPAGADAADGMIQSGSALGNETLEETWTGHKARMQGQDGQRAFAQMWQRRGVKALRNSDYLRAIRAFEQALVLERESKDRRGEGLALLNLGGVYSGLRQYEQAIAYYEQALALRRESKDRAGEGLTLNTLGVAYHGLRQYEQAIAYYEQALALRREVKDRAGEGSTLHKLGEAYQGQHQHEQAIAYYEQALALRREVKDRAGEGLTLNNLGMAYQELRQYEQAIAYYEQALALRREVKDRAGEGSPLHKLGEAYQGQHQHEQAIAYYEQALTLRRESKDRAGEASTLSSLGMAYQRLSQHEQAIAYYEQALTLRRELKDRAWEGLALHNLGSAYYGLSQFGQAIAYYEQALALQRESKDRAGEAFALGILGMTYERLHQHEQAIAYHEQALALRRELKDRAGEGLALHNLGSAYYALHQYERAIAYYEQALALRRELKDRAGEGSTLRNLGETYKGQRQYERAIAYYEQALALQRESKDRYGEGSALRDLGMVYERLHQHERAIAYYEQALALQRESKDRAGEGVTLVILGGAYKGLHQHERAIAYYEQALALQRENKDRYGEAATLYYIMDVWQARQAPRLAIFYGKQAVNMFQAIRGDIGNLDTALQQSFLGSMTGLYRTLAALLITAGRLPEAQQVLELLKADEYFDFIRRDSQAAGRTQYATLTPEEAIWEQHYRMIADGVTTLGAENRMLLAKASRTAEDNARLDVLDHDLRIAAGAFEEFFSRLKEAFRDTPAVSTRLAEIEQAQGLMADLVDLGPGTVALYTLVSEQAYQVILITPDTQVARSSPIRAEVLNRKVQDLREALRTPMADPRPLAQELYQILVAPVAKDLEDAQAQTLMWSLDGVLRYLPVAALHDGEAYLVERYRHVIFTPVSKARLKDVPQTTWRGLGLGVSQAHGDFAALPGVVEELRGIIRDKDQPGFLGVLPGTAKLDAAFTAPAMRTALRDRYPAVHIASHFQFRPGNETASFLLLGDGSHLPLSEIKAWPNVFAGVDLLTLSACDTALGAIGADGREVEGFGAMAQKLGAKAVLATLWPVADVSTTVFMQEFYRQRETQPGLPKIEALRQAQLALLHGHKPTGNIVAHGEQGLLDRVISSAAALLRFSRESPAPYAHPFFWAPFILIGNWK